MPRCDASRYAVTVRLPSKLKGVVDLKDHKGQDARAVLDVLVSEGCKMETKCLEENEIGPDQEAVWDGERFTFYNFLANTNEVGERLSLPLVEVVKALDCHVLTGTTTPNGHYRLVLKDEKHDNCDVSNLKVVVTARKPKKYRGRGLKKMVFDAIGKGSLPSSFGVKEVERFLASVNWRAGVHYSEKSVLSAITDLSEEGHVTLQKDGMVKDRVWSVTARQVSVAVTPSRQSLGGHIDQIVENLAEDIVNRAKERAKEMLGL